jgi:hypothetical protein
MARSHVTRWAAGPPKDPENNAAASSNPHQLWVAVAQTRSSLRIESRLWRVRSRISPRRKPRAKRVVAAVRHAAGAAAHAGRADVIEPTDRALPWWSTERTAAAENTPGAPAGRAGWVLTTTTDRRGAGTPLYRPRWSAKLTAGRAFRLGNARWATDDAVTARRSAAH